ncbi:MAG TPA: ABC transporter permease subunit [Thermomicrobiales bacterium]|nr:ABC transporter permease subunit [Thermomicrobiales bacterium]
MATARSMLDPTPILGLTLRQFIGGKSIRIVFLFSLVPALFSLIFMLDSGDLTSREFFAGIFQEFIAPTLLPIATLILATNALGNEVEDRTMVYLVLKPISRMRIVLEKFAAVALTATLLLWEGTLLAYLLAMRGDAGNNIDQLLAICFAQLIGVLGYGALFMAISLIVPRALLAGLIYALLWESLFGRFIPGIRLVSVRHYVQSIYVRAIDNPAIDLDEAMRFVPALIVIALLVVASLAITTWRLQTMNLE